MLVNEQHGFRRAKFTITNSLVFYSYLVETVPSGIQIYTISTDLYKAFDKVDHYLLLVKLRKRIRDSLLSWFSSYLCEQSQLVRILTKLSPILQR